MLMTRTPVRIPLGGGGTDLPFYAQDNGGFLVSAAINKYIYVILNKHFEKNFRICYSKKEIVETADEIKHPVVHEIMKILEINGGIEVVSLSDVPANTGLGTSSSFTVGMINALSSYKKMNLTKYEMAELAVKVERELLAEQGGIQDQYIASFGGICCIDIPPCNKEIVISPLRISHDCVKRLEQNIYFFFTGLNRDSWKIQREIEEAHKAKSSQSEIKGSLDKIKEIGFMIKDALVKGDADKFGSMLNEHWETKKRLSGKISNSWIDSIYDLAMENGALGGKLMGAGGGGYFMFYCSSGSERLKGAVRSQGLEEMPFKFDFEGTSLLVCDDN